jgi:hypothetical protein
MKKVLARDSVRELRPSRVIKRKENKVADELSGRKSEKLKLSGRKK